MQGRIYANSIHRVRHATFLKASVPDVTRWVQQRPRNGFLQATPQAFPSYPRTCEKISSFPLHVHSQSDVMCDKAFYNGKYGHVRSQCDSMCARAFAKLSTESPCKAKYRHVHGSGCGSIHMRRKHA